MKDTVRNAHAVSATVLTLNSGRRLAEVLRALRWCDEVLVLDTGSVDQTVSIARSFANVRVHLLEGPFTGFGHAHRQAVSLARNDWILSIDSDEVLSESLAEELRALPLESGEAYSLPFQTYVCGRLLRPPFWYSERHPRLFNRRMTTFTKRDVHERVCTKGLKQVELRNHVLHYSYDSVDDYLAKMQAYSSLFARMERGRRKGSAARAVVHSSWSFLRHYVLKGGVLQGRDGFGWSVFQAHTTFWKYFKLAEANASS